MYKLGIERNFSGVRKGKSELKFFDKREILLQSGKLTDRATMCLPDGQHSL